MIRKTMLLVAALMAAVLPAAMPAHAAGPVLVSGPGSYLTNYTIPATAAQVGGELTYANLDIAPHDVVAEAYGTDDKPWCGGFAPGRCPLFWSPLVFIGQSTQVFGLESVTAGNAYAFYCSLHRNMRGTLVALPGA